MSRRLDNGYEDPGYYTSLFSIAPKISEFSSRIPNSEPLLDREIITDLHKAYKNNKLVLVLGSGISTVFGVPKWEDLLTKLLIYVIKNDPDVSEELANIYRKSFSLDPLIMARFIQNAATVKNNGETKFKQLVKKVLYENEILNSESKTIPAIGKMINNNSICGLDSVISYNYDDYLERHLDSIDCQYKPIYSADQSALTNSLSIYHVHGFLPKSGPASEDELILGEASYHNQYYDVYKWSNVIQLSKFLNSTCLFIGFSLKDPNVRRLLDVAFKQSLQSSNKHYIFRKRHERKSESEKAIMDFDERIDTSDAMSLGIKTIWINEWDDISLYLSKIRIGEIKL